MKKFEGWRTEELQYIASLIAGRELLPNVQGTELYDQVIREIRNRRVNDELQTKLNLEGPSNP